MIYAVCEDGYTINFYQRNVPPPKKWIEKGYSPTQYQIDFMLDAFLDQYNNCGMDNMFILEKFLQVAYSEIKYKTMVHGVFRKKGCGLPEFLHKKIIQKIKNLVT